MLVSDARDRPEGGLPLVSAAPRLVSALSLRADALHKRKRRPRKAKQQFSLTGIGEALPYPIGRVPLKILTPASKSAKTSLGAADKSVCATTRASARRFTQ